MEIVYIIKDVQNATYLHTNSGWYDLDYSLTQTRQFTDSVYATKCIQDELTGGIYVIEKFYIKP